ncbi:MAG: hypothetical protein LBU70_09855 [Chitinispirillales bacterium]|jgi:long-subunit fatty acid transport protein|nr:hypothetical protein [Chitinispirillales bacterium]
MKKSVLAALIFYMAVSAQQSPLGSRYPFGIPDLAVTGSAAALGGGGAAVAEEQMGICLNPANAAIGSRAAFSAMVSFDLTNISGDGGSSWIHGYSPQLMSLIIPFGRAGNAAFSMQQQYNANLNFGPDTTIDGYKTDIITLHRTGGVTAWQAGWAYRFRSGFGVGILYEHLFFNSDSRDIFVTRFSDERMINQMTIGENTVTSLSAGGIRLGMQIPVHERVMLGVAAAGIFHGKDNGTEMFMRSYRDNTYASTQFSWDVQEESVFSSSLPSSFNIGAAYKPDDRWLFAADAYMTLWGLWDDADTHFDSRDLRSTTLGISAGARFIPAANLLSSTYVEKIHYSTGLRYTSLPGTSAHEYALYLGTGLPIANDGGLIDVVLSFGQRIDTQLSKYSENIFKIQLGINGGRSWFHRGDI